ncbi:MAG: DedA family protein [candidate division WOR-3 bacterium]
MELFGNFLELFLHIDKHLDRVIQTYGTATYLLLFGIIFVETGLVVTPFLPGDSLLFTAGVFAGRGALEVEWLYLLLTTAAILGDNTNYWIGRFVGPRVFRSESARFLKKEYLHRTHRFFERYGTKAIIMARFVPIVRTFMPFVAGIGAMTYRRFFFYDLLGGNLWVSICVFAGYFFGGLPFVKQNFSLVVLAIVFISVLPAILEYLKNRRSSTLSPPPKPTPLTPEEEV